MDHHNFEGKEIPHIKLDSKMTIKEPVSYTHLTLPTSDLV